MKDKTKHSLYLETTIPSYLAARTSKNLEVALKQARTHEFYELERHKYDLFVSDYVYEECSKGDKFAAQKRLEFLEEIMVLQITSDVMPLADVYAQLLSIPEDSLIDARHLAICCVNGIDILLSWNLKHLGPRSMQIVQRYNDRCGLPTPLMVTPYSLIE